MNIPEKMNERIRFLRIKHGYTQQEIINILGVGKSAYSMYENGERTISVEIVAKLAQLYNVTTDFIIGVSNNTQVVASTVESYLDNDAIKTITKMGNLRDHNPLTALNTLLSDKQCIKLFANLYKALYVPSCPNSRSKEYWLNDSPVLEAETMNYLKNLLGLSDIASDYSDDILKKITSEIGISTKRLTKEARNVAKMLFMMQMESFIERNPTHISGIRVHKNIKKSILNEE